MRFLLVLALILAIRSSRAQDAEPQDVQPHPMDADIADVYESFVIEPQTSEPLPPPTEAPADPPTEAPAPPSPIPDISYEIEPPNTPAPNEPAHSEPAPKDPIADIIALKAPVIELIEEALAVEPPSTHPLPKQTVILNAGKKLSEGLTAKIVGPIVIFNSKVAAAAGALPPLLAAKGAIIGSAIATPIEIGAVASSGLVSSAAGKLVAVPITVAAGAAAKFVGAAQRGEQVVQFNLEHGGEILKDGLIRIGQMILKPIAIVVGAQTAITGAGIGIAGTGIKGVGVGIEAVGAKMLVTGLKAKALGGRLIQAQFPPYLK